ncbi:MAG: hypothetical protein A3D74_00140 [Candidatus Levybacteria bacterium RIFCSPHIGHO2_02_FULL_37_13]|nr:MAG: hypothetical protein A3D74_00140 [Candidatus Levybacteria bacterium RIFCSPHIGHO2_02_FULL_37_13]
MESRDPKEPIIDPEVTRKLKIFHAIENLKNLPEEKVIGILIQVGDLILDYKEKEKVIGEERDNKKILTHLTDMLSGENARKFREASEEALRNGGIERWPEIDSEGAERVEVKPEISKKEKLPRTNEEKYAYILYRKGGLGPEEAFLFATKGFIFDNPNSPYIPVDTAVQISNLVNSMIGDTDKTEDENEPSFSDDFSDEDGLKIFLDTPFAVEDISPATQILIDEKVSSESLGSIGEHKGFSGLPQIARTEILKDYMTKGKKMLGEEIQERFQEIKEMMKEHGNLDF